MPGNRSIRFAHRFVSGSVVLLSLCMTVAVPVRWFGGSLILFGRLVLITACVLTVVAIEKNQREFAALFRDIKIKKRIDTCVIYALVLLQILFTMFFIQENFQNAPILAAMTESAEKNLLPEASQLFVSLFAAWGRMIRVHPSILANTFAGLLFLPLFYMSFLLAGYRIFHGNRRKTMLFVGIAILFFSIGSGADMNFSFMRGETIFAGLLFPYLIFWLSEWGRYYGYERIMGIFVFWTAIAFTGKPSLTIAGVVGIVFLICFCGEPFWRDIWITICVKWRQRGQHTIEDEEGREEDFMNTKKGKLLFAGYFILIPIILLLVFSIFKLNNKINSVYLITQEISDRLTEQESVNDTEEPDSEESVSVNALSENEVDETEQADAMDNATGGDYTLSCFSEADGKSFITFDTQETESYQLFQRDVNEDAGGLSYIILLPSGGLAIVDGGYYGDGVQLCDFIAAHGGKVEAWFLTHPHYDHIGAFLYCMTEGRSDIEVEKVYYAPFTSEFVANSDRLTEELEYEAFDFAEFEQIRTNETGAEFVPMTVGAKVETDGMITECLSSFDSSVDDVNGNSLVLKMTMNGISMMVTGDITEATVDRMVAKYGTDPEVWDVNFLQIPHHGYTGTGEQLYDLTQPEFALLDCSTTEYNSDVLGIQSGTVSSLHDRGIGIVKRFEGTNVVLIK